MTPATVYFTIAKKMNKSAAGSLGLALRSLSGSFEKASAVLLAPEYGLLKAKAEQYRMKSGRPLHVRARGKSLEVFTEAGLTGESALSALMDFLSDAPFSAEEARDVVEFYNRCLGFDAQPLSETLAPAGLRALEMRLDLDEMQLSAEATLGGDQDRETLYDVVASALTPYGMGIIKETPGQVAENPV